MISGQQIFDPGLQLERTGIAWRRTILSLVVTLSIQLRPLAEFGSGVWTVLAACCGVGAALIAVQLAQHRYRRLNSALMATRSLASDGIALAVLAVVAGLAGMPVLLSGLRT